MGQIKANLPLKHSHIHTRPKLMTDCEAPAILNRVNKTQQSNSSPRKVIMENKQSLLITSSD